MQAVPVSPGVGGQCQPGDDGICSSGPGGGSALTAAPYQVPLTFSSWPQSRLKARALAERTRRTESDRDSRRPLPEEFVPNRTRVWSRWPDLRALVSVSRILGRVFTAALSEAILYPKGHFSVGGHFACHNWWRPGTQLTQQKVIPQMPTLRTASQLRRPRLAEGKSPEGMLLGSDKGQARRGPARQAWRSWWHDLSGIHPHPGSPSES